MLQQRGLVVKFSTLTLACITPIWKLERRTELSERGSQGYTYHGIPKVKLTFY